MKTFEEALAEEVGRHKSDLENTGCGQLYILTKSMLFIEGALFARTSPELINEIIDKYFIWTRDLPITTVKKWSKEEGDFKKTKARIRREFFKYLNQK